MTKASCSISSVLMIFDESCERERAFDHSLMAQSDDIRADPRQAPQAGRLSPTGAALVGQQLFEYTPEL